MKKSVLFFFFLALSISAYSQADKWISLFNGKNLDGWTQKGGQARYTVEKGVIVGTSAPNTLEFFPLYND